MKVVRVITGVLLAGILALPAQASLINWDFSWENEHTSRRTSTVTTYMGIGSFSYDDSAAVGNEVTHGERPGFWIFPAKDVADELVSFSFEGFINGESTGQTKDLPSYFSFSPEPEAFIWSMSANKGGDGSGIGCALSFCTLYLDGDRDRRSTGIVSLETAVQFSLFSNIGGPGLITGLTEPGTFGLMGLGLLFGGLFGRRREVD